MEIAARKVRKQRARRIKRPKSEPKNRDRSGAEVEEAASRVALMRRFVPMRKLAGHWRGMSGEPTLDQGTSSQQSQEGG
jgi:hypothetical protein